jgi:hypothetical protein
MTIQAGKPRVVVVDEDPGSRSAVARVPARSGFDVHSAAGVSDAFGLVGLHGCDLLAAAAAAPEP